MLFFSSLLYGNPFLGEADGPTPVRPPSVSAPQKLIDAQLQFREKIGDLLTEWKGTGEEEGRGTILLPLLGLGFLYGILHALGPGHRKTVIFSLFLSRKTHFLEPLGAGFFSAFLHGLSAVGIILFFRTLSSRVFLQKVDATAIYLEGITYLLLVLLASCLLIYEIIGQFSHRGRSINHKKRGLYSTILITSTFPCPIAVMILIFSLTMDVLGLGIITVMALSAGMGVVISFFGFLARTGRETLFLWFQNRQRTINVLGQILEMGSYLFLILFSLWMALPFLTSMVSRAI